jgi:putative ABC transport system substrate-binding protein
MIRRREFIATLGGAAVWPVAARAQQGDRVRRIGVLVWGDENDPEQKRRLSAFTQALSDLGWTDRRNVRMDLRWHGDDNNRIRASAQELVGLQPDIIVTDTTPATTAVQRETQTIPIVFAGASDPVATGIVPRLNQPGANITGFAFYEASLGGKWLELLSEIAPGLKRAAIMFNPDTSPASAHMPSLETAARSLKVVLITAPAHSDVEIETAIIALAREPGGGLVVMPDAFMTVRRAMIISAAARNNVPAVYPHSAYPRDGGLLSYGVVGRRHLSSRRQLCRSHSTRREAGRSSGAVSDKIRDGREPQDRQGARSCGTPVDHAARRRGHRISAGYDSYWHLTSFAAMHKIR